MKNLKVSLHPLGGFFILTSLNGLMIYGPFTETAKIFLVLAFLSVWLVLLVGSKKDNTVLTIPADRFNLGFKSSLIPFIVFPVFAVIIYFWKLNGVERWQGGDAIQPGVYAIDLLQRWNWHFFETFGQIPSTGSYLCYSLLKITHSPFFSFQFPAAFLALLMILVGYGAVRQHFSPAFSITFLCLFSLNSWALDLSRFIITLPLWELLVFYVWSQWHYSTSSRAQNTWAGILGFTLGLGSFTFPSWLALAPVIFLLVYQKCKKESKSTESALLLFIFFFIFALAPFLSAVQSEGYGEHIGHIGIWNDFSAVKMANNFAGYFGVLFWGPPGQGVLNLFNTSFFFLGTIELVRFRRQPLALWAAACFALFLLPGLLSNTVETNRILLVFPLLMLVSCVGIRSLVLYFFPQKRTAALMILIFLSCGLDLVQFFTADAKKIFNEKKKSYEILEKIQASRGPGLIFSEMFPVPVDHSLYYYSYFFNAALNPDLNPESSTWCSVYTENDDEPFLQRKFPGSQWIDFPTERPGVKSRHVLGLIPVDTKTRPLFLQWAKFYASFQKLNFKAMDFPNGRSQRPLLEYLLGLYARTPNDPFLQSCYFEKLSYHYTWEKNFHPEDAWASWEVFGPLFQKSFQRSYQNGNLCEKYARLLAMEGKIPEARKVFMQALKIYPGNEWLQTELRQLDSPN